MYRTLTLLLLLTLPLFAHPEVEKKSPDRVDILRDTFGITASSPGDYDWDEVMQGCPRRDCIPSIDQPKFLKVEQVDFLSDEDLIIAISSGEESRAYPISILVWHELVNDVFAGTPVVVSYCPLCGSGLVFERMLDGAAVEFGAKALAICTVTDHIRTGAALSSEERQSSLDDMITMALTAVTA